MGEFFAELKRRNVLRVALAYLAGSWLLIQVVETVFPVFGFSDAAVRSFIVILAIGFLPALIFAWVFELTPEGLMLEKEIDRSASITAHTGKSLDRVIIVVLLLAVSYFAVDKFVLDPARDESLVTEARQEGRADALIESYGDRSIGVLPFVDMSPEGDQEYFGDGLSEELLNLLAKIPQLRVASRSSAFAYKGKDVSITEIGKGLNVAYVMEGSVRKLGNVIRITAQLIDAKSDTHVFSETYDATLDHIFAVQDEIASKIVDSLKVTLLEPMPKAQVVDPVAYELYLRGWYLNGKVSQDNLQNAVRLLEEATQLDPSYPPAWVSLGVAYRNQAQYGYRDQKEGTEMARAAYERALEIDPEYGHAWGRLAAIYASYDWDFAAADDAVGKALKLSPNEISNIGAAARLAFTLGRFVEAISLYRRSLSIEPLDMHSSMMLSWALMYDGQLEAASAQLRDLMTLDSEYPLAHTLLGQVLLLQGKPEEALDELALESEQEWKEFGTVLALYALGRNDDALVAANEFIEKHGDVWLYQIAVIHAYRNDTNGAFDWLDRAYRERDSGMVLLLGDPFLANIRDDDRWDEIIDKVGL